MTDLKENSSWHELSYFDQSILMWRWKLWFTKREDIIEFIKPFYKWVIPDYMMNIIDHTLSSLSKNRKSKS